MPELFGQGTYRLCRWCLGCTYRAKTGLWQWGTANSHTDSDGTLWVVHTWLDLGRCMGWGLGYIPYQCWLWGTYRGRAGLADSPSPLAVESGRLGGQGHIQGRLNARVDQLGRPLVRAAQILCIKDCNVPFSPYLKLLLQMNMMSVKSRSLTNPLTRLPPPPTSLLFNISHLEHELYHHTSTNIYMRQPSFLAFK